MNALKLVVGLIISFSLNSTAVAAPFDFLRFLRQEANSVKKVQVSLDHLSDENATARYNAELEIIKFYQFETPDGETHTIILALMRLRDDLTFEESVREHARRILETKKIEYLQSLENQKEENLRSDIWFNLKHPMRAWNDETYRLAAAPGRSQRREALKRLPLIDGSLIEVVEALLYYKNYAAFTDENEMAQEAMQYILSNHNPTVVISALLNFIDANPNKTKDRLIGWREEKIRAFTDAIEYLAQIKHHHALDYLASLHKFAYLQVKSDLRVHVEESLSAVYHGERNQPFGQTLSIARRAVDEYMVSSLYAERNSH